MDPERIMQRAREAAQAQRWSQWPPWEDQLLRAAHAFAANGDRVRCMDALRLWRTIAEGGGCYYWGRRKEREHLLAGANGLIPQEFRALLEHPPRREGSFTRGLGVL